MSANVPLPPTAWTTGSTEAVKTGTWRASLPHYIRPPSPCHQACPVNGDIAEWIGLARARDFRGAWEVLTRNNPFPAIAGRICHHPCEAACNRGGYDEALAICKLERAVGDIALEQGWTFAAPAGERPLKVAVVGGGPSGLSAAYQLRRLGYQVALYEAKAELGGLMRYGIPSYRLSRDVLDGEIGRIIELGIQVHCGHPISDPGEFERLRASHDAVYVAIGAGRPKRLPQLPQDASWLMDGADYLARCSAGTPPALGKRVLVVGGGSAALDAARSARRAGHEVTILSLERAAQMPAQREEVAEALEEGISLVDGAMLTAAAQNGAGLVLTCVRVNLEFGAVRGQFKILPVSGSEFSLGADAVVTSIGQDPQLDAFSSFLPVNGNLLAVDARSQSTATERVWAGGDVASMARFVTEAAGMGKRAALDIDRQLRGDQAARASAEAAVVLAKIATYYHPKQPRPAETRRSPAERLASGIEVQLGLELEQALAEAGRCFSCGNCTACDNCFNYCPDLAIQRVPEGGYQVLADYCKGCGVCVRECPTGSMTMREEER